MEWELRALPERVQGAQVLDCLRRGGGDGVGGGVEDCGSAGRLLGGRLDCWGC